MNHAGSVYCSSRCVKRLVLAVSLAGIAALCVFLPARALPVPGMLKVGGQSLAPASCATRSTLWIHHYAAALFVPADASSPAAALEDPKQAKALQVEILNRSFLPRQVPSQWERTLEGQLDDAALGSIHAAWRSLGAGDRVTITYAPGPGVSLKVNDRVVAAAPTHRIVDAMLQAWAQDEPVYERVRRVVARHPCGR